MVIITGSGQGLGASAAKLFAQHGARIVVSDINAAKANQARLLVTPKDPWLLSRHQLHIIC